MTRLAVLASAFLALAGIATQAGATNIYFQYGPSKICQVKVAAGADIIADTIGGTYLVGTSFVNPPPNGRTEAGDIYIASATADATACGTSSGGSGNLPATPSATVTVSPTTLPTGQTSTPISVAVANATQCTASATLNGVAQGVAGWNGVVCSSLATCNSFTSATASGLSSGSYVFSLTCIDTVVSGNVTSTATGPVASSSAVTVSNNLSSCPVYSPALTSQTRVPIAFGNSSTTAIGDANNFGSIYGITPQQVTPVVPWPGVQNANIFATVSTNNYIPVSFVPSGAYHGAYSTSVSAGQENASMTISTCPGDFRNAVVAGVLGAGCFADSNGKGNVGITLLWDTNPSGTNVRCHLTPGKTYYLNILQAPLSANATRPTSYCTGSGCQTGLYTTFSTGY